MFAVYRASTRAEGKKTMTRLINSIASAAPTSLAAVCKLRRVRPTRGAAGLAF